MATHELRTVADGLTYLEGPRWHDGQLYFVDFYTYAVYTVTKDGKVEKVLDVPQQPSGLGWLPDGRMLVVSMKDRKVLRVEADGSVVEHADIHDLCTGHANDMVVAPNGNAYIGEFGFDLMGGADFEVANVILVKPDGTAQVVAKNMCFPNGMVVTPDEKTLIVNELFGNRISKFAINDDGTLGERQDFANFGDLGAEGDVGKRIEAAKILPDGLTLDAEGAVWFADTLHRRAVRMADGGEILDTVDATPDGIFATGLGGDDGRTLFMCAAPDWDEAARSAAREGRMRATTVDVPHAGTP